MAVDTWQGRDDASPDPRCGRTRLVRAHGFVLSEFVLGAGYQSLEHAHALSGLVLPVAGTLAVTEGRTSRSVHPGEALPLPAGAAHGERAARPAICLLLELTGEAGDHPPGLFDRPRPLGHPDLAPAVSRLARRLRAGAGGEWEREYEAVELVILVTQARLRRPEGGGPAPLWVRGLTERLHLEFRAPPSLVELARDAGVSREHLAREFRRATGQTAGEFVRRRRLLEATRLLRESRLTLAAVAAVAGFTDQSHLTRHLRRYLGVTPGEVRMHAAPG